MPGFCCFHCCIALLYWLWMWFRTMMFSRVRCALGDNLTTKHTATAIHQHYSVCDSHHALARSTNKHHRLIKDSFTSTLIRFAPARACLFVLSYSNYTITQISHTNTLRCKTLQCTALGVFYTPRDNTFDFGASELHRALVHGAPLPSAGPHSWSLADAALACFLMDDGCTPVVVVVNIQATMTYVDIFS